MGRVRVLISDQGKIKTEVTARDAVLMNLHCNGVRACNKVRRSQHHFQRRGFIRAADRYIGQRIVGNWTCDQILAVNFHAVDVNDDTVIANQPHKQAVERSGIRHDKFLSEISRHIFEVGIRAITDGRHFTVTAVAK